MVLGSTDSWFRTRYVTVNRDFGIFWTIMISDGTALLKPNLSNELRTPASQL